MQLLSTGYQRSGKNCRVAVGSTPAVLAHSKFSCNETGDDLPTVNFTSYITSFNQPAVGTTPDEGIVGVQSLDWTCGGDWDAHVNFYDASVGGSPPGFYPRDDLANLYFYENVVDNIFWKQPYARVRTANNSGEVTGKVTFEAGGKNQGSYTRPTGNV